MHLVESFDLIDTVTKFQDGLYLLVADPRLGERLLSRIDHRYLCFECIRPGYDINRERALLALAEREKIRVVASGNFTLRSSQDYELHRTLVAIRENQLVSKLDASRLALPGHHLRPPEEFAQLFHDLPGAVRNTLRVARDCSLELPMGKPIFPDYALPSGETAYSHLCKRSFDGLKWRYNPLVPEAAERLTYELNVISRLGFCEYFLVVADIVSFAREQGIPSVGRGSGASSIISYVLGITNVDPIRYNIHFERFLNLSRSDCPDIDIDLCWKRRDDVINHVYEQYGAEHVAMISTHNTFRNRSAFREVAKAWGVSNANVNQLAKALPHDTEVPIEEVLGKVPTDLDVSDQRLRKIVSLARRIVGYPNHLSVHCGGIVISPRPIDCYVPLQWAAKGIVITQYEMNAVEDIGLVKIDLLGNRALSTISHTLQLVEAERGQKLTVEDLPEDDERTFALMRKGLTLGCNQAESPAMRNLLQMSQPKKLMDVIIALALIRPGAATIGMKEKFIRRLRGLEPVTYPHPCVKEVLEESFGIMLYEDDAMLVASKMAGLPLEEGDKLRKAIRKCKTDEERIKVSRYFLGKCVKNGVPLDAAKDMWIQMAKFNEYSFCKSHACGYGQLAYYCTYLKAHFPAEFMVAVMEHHAGMYPKLVHIEEAKRLGVKILSPCVNRSEIEFTVEQGAIRIGLQQVMGLNRKAMLSIVESRADGSYHALNDFLARVAISFDEVESLILCGAFDFTQRKRTELLWEVKMTFDTEKRNRGDSRLFHGDFHARKRPQLRDHTPEEKTAHEIEILQMTTGAHVLKGLRQRLRVRNVADSRAIRRRIGKHIRLIGMLDATRRTDTSNGRVMQFITLEDEYGLWEVTLFPNVYKRCGGQFTSWGPYLVEGKVESHYDSITINASRIRLLG